MKFVCDRCLTKYSIADDKVRGRILKIRCKSCSNIITVKESAPAPISVADGESDRTVITSGPIVARPPAPAAPSIARAKAEPGRPLRPPTPPAPQPAGDDIQWFMAVEGVQKGPFSRKALVDKLVTLPRNSDVHVWNDTLDGWKPPTDVPAIARELQARSKHAPAAPPPPPAPRLRPVPPPPSRGASGAHRLPHAPPAPHGGGGAHAHATGGHGHGGAAHAAAVSQHHHAHPVASHSAVGLGLASVAPMQTAHGAAAALEANSILDTPAPIRELVQAHKANGEARLSGSYATASAAPHALATNGESDALQALNLGQSWRQPGAPLAQAEGSLSSSAMASAAHLGAARQRNRNLKLATGFIAFAAVCVVVIFFALKKPPTPASAANPPVAIGEAAGAGKTPAGAPKEVKDPSPGGETAEAAGETDPPGSALKTETVARISSGKKPPRQPGLRNPGGRNAVTGTAPGSFTPEQLQQQQQQRIEASRYADTSAKPLLVRPMAPTVAKVTPNQTDIAHVVNANKGGIKICYQRALLRDSSLTHGKIDVTVSIGISGRVKNVSIEGPAAFRSLDPCIKDVLSRWVFPASSEEYGTGFSYVFQGNE